MIVMFSKKARVVAETLCFTSQVLRRYGEKSKHAGEEYWENLGHYRTLEQAARVMLDKAAGDLGRQGTVSAQELIEAVRKAGLRIAEACECAPTIQEAQGIEDDCGPVEMPDDLFDDLGVAS